MEKTRIVYVWELPVRVTHWVNVASILTLSATGLYIGAVRSLAHDPSSFVMGWFRFVHFVAAYVFAVSTLARIYWSLAGNRYASWRAFFPWTGAEGRGKMLATLKYYLFLDKRVPHVVGHNTLAATTYSLVMILYLVMIVTGFALYGEHAPGSWYHAATAPLLVLFTNQGLRLTHHLVMWLILAFAIHHVYSAWLMDIKERGGVMSSIFSGYKTIEEKE